MIQQIESDKLTINQLFERWYRIPNYQRPYVWGKDQIVDLLDDVIFALQQNDKAEYFLGSFVLQTKKDSDGNYLEDDVLDGQQRLTTLILIFAVIREVTLDEQLRETCQDILFQKGNKFKGIPQRPRLIFDIRDDVRDFVESHVITPGKVSDKNSLIRKEGSSKDISIRNMISALINIQEYFEESETSVEDFFTYLNTKGVIIYVSSENLDDAFRMFTILNNRGVKLRNSDILKAENLRVVEDKDQVKYAKYWEDIENYFEEDFDNFLSHVRSILVKEKARLNLYDEFKKNIYDRKKYLKEEKRYEQLNPLLKRGNETFELLKKYKDHYSYVFDQDHYYDFGDHRYDNLITIMSNVLPADFWIPVLLRYYDKFGNEQLPKFLEMLDNKFSFDWIVGFTPTERIENMNSLIKLVDETNINELDKLFDSIEFKIKVDTLMDTLKGNIYGRRFARYILYKLDYLFSSGDKINVPKIISVEHILPQNPKKDSDWNKKFDEEQKEKYTNKIGNLVLISRRKNSSQGRREYIDKREKYFTGNIELFRNSTRLITMFEDWKPEDIEKNTKLVLGKIKDHYNKNK